MAMNKQRRSSNISNIFSYDDAGNIVIKDYGQVTRYSWNGLIHGFVGPLSISSVSAATTDTDRFLVSDGGVLKYRTGVELLSDIGGVPSTRTLTINGVTQDLSADRTFTIAAGISGTITTGQVAFGSGTNTIGGSSNLFWDNANSRLGIGTASPDYELVVTKPASSSFKINTGANSVDIISTTSLSPHFVNNFLFYYGIPGSGVNKMTLFGATGNLVLQNGGTFLDGGQRLQVYGDAFVKGSGATFATNALTIQNSASTNIFRVQNDGTTFVNTFQAFSASSNIGFFLTGSSAIGIGGTNATNFQNTDTLQITRPYTPSSGAFQHTLINITSTINQTGGANGITRGLHVNPTLTAAADWRSIEWSNNSGWGLYGAGTAPNFLGGNLTISRNHNAATSFIISNTTSGTNAGCVIQFDTNVAVSSAQIGKSSSGSGSYKIFSAADFFITNGGTPTNGDIGILNDRTAGIIKFASGGSSTAQMTLTAAGRLLLGTVTEGTFLLDVNGTARVQLPSVGASSYFVLSSASATAINSYFGVTGSDFTFSKGEYSWGSNLRFNGTTFVRDNTGVGSWMISQSCGNDVANHFFRIRNVNPNVGTVNSSAFVIGGSGIIGINREPVSGVGLSVSGTIGGDGLIIDQSVNRYVLGLASGSLRLTLNDAAQPVFQIANSSSTAIVFNSTNSYASAQLAIDSTTRGFLPPRMTTTQKNAIATPAAGLQVYDSTTNVPNYYDGTSWVAMGGGAVSGTYTPTVTVISGGATSVTSNVARYIRVGNVVTVYGAFFYQPSGSGAVETNNQFSITLPITRTVTTNFASGTVSFSTVSGVGNQSQGYLYSTSTTVIDLYCQNWWSGSGANAYYVFSYEIN